MSGLKGLMAFGAVAISATMAAAPAQKPIALIDLSKAFGTRTPWRFTAFQGPDASPDETPSGASDPGVIRMCLSNDGGKSCRPDLAAAQRAGAEADAFSDAHFLQKSQIVQPRGPGAPSLFLLQTASWHGGNGDQRVTTQALAYDGKQDSFVRIYAYRVGRNRNEEVRYIADGPMRGDIVSAEPTENAPFGFWITVSTLTPFFTYQQALRFRSATHYGDGNPLAVIDSEMPNIRQRLGLWHPGQPLPLPERPCPRPHLVGMGLWCS